MKKVIIFLLFLAISFASASIDVNNYSFKTTYIPSEQISGKINLTIRNEPININFSSNQGGSVSLEKVLESYSNHSCSPADCLQSYKTIEVENNFQIDSDKIYAGFFLKGKQIEITGINFSLLSDFAETSKLPLKIKFFDGEDWELDSFSKNYSSKNFACFSEKVKSIGPLIGTPNYCERVNLSTTNSYYVGAILSDNKADNKELEMSVYDSYGSLVGDCIFNPNSEEGCQIENEDEGVFSNGTYSVCVSADSSTKYHIYEDTSSPNCGFVYSYEDEDIEKDYGIFVKSALYVSGQEISTNGIDKENILRSANDFIETKYKGNCTLGCILPIEISGVPQNLNFNNMSLYYSKNGEVYSENKIYSLDIIPAIVNFNGVIDLNKIGLNAVNKGNYILYLGGKKIFSEKIDFLPAPILVSISPLNPPAGIPVVFYIGVQYNESMNALSYKWNFGDGKIETTTSNFITHTFNEIKNYSLSIEASRGNITVKKNFTIGAISPQNATRISLMRKKEALNKLASILNSLPAFYGTPLKTKVNFEYYQNLITELEKQNKNASSQNDYLKIATKLYSTNFISDIYVEESSLPFLLTKLDEINPSAVEAASGESLSNIDKYKDQILAWQEENIEVDMSSKKITIIMEDGAKTNSINYYNIKINQDSDEDSYLVVGKPANEIFFNNNLHPVSSSGASTIPISGGSRTIEFYYFDTTDAPIFVSPKLSTLIAEPDINKKCNFNEICENGEDYKTCRSDCKPYSNAIIYSVVAFMVFLFFYTILQIWYKNHYENYLFGDRQQIYNLLMFIANARARGVSDGEIIKSLKSQGWSTERISYIIKKSYGKRTGMIEIIPISRISTYFRNKKARKNVQNSETLINRRG